MVEDIEVRMMNIHQRINDLLGLKNIDDAIEIDRVQGDSKHRRSWYGAIYSNFTELIHFGVKFPDELIKRVDYLILKISGEQNDVGYINPINIKEGNEIIDEILRITNEQIN